MFGQWIGPYQGTNHGIAMVDLDDCGDHVEGNAYIFDDVGLPGTLAPIRTLDTSPRQTLELDLTPLHPTTPSVVARDQLASVAPNVIHPEKAAATFELKGSSLLVSWTTSIGTTGAAALAKSRSTEPSDYSPEKGIRTWKTFKEYASTIEPERYVFRGQSQTRRLRTAFHRSKRKDLIRFMNLDIPTLHRLLMARTKHLFDLANPLHNAAFYNLIQHHGYPTPLLDWTYSPFVAAYFALRPGRDRGRSGDSVRIFMLDQKA